MIYLTDSERQAVTWAAARGPAAALDWANAQLEGAEQEAAPG